MSPISKVSLVFGFKIKKYLFPYLYYYDRSSKWSNNENLSFLQSPPTSPWLTVALCVSALWQCLSLRSPHVATAQLPPVPHCPLLETASKPCSCLREEALFSLFPEAEQKPIWGFLKTLYWRVRDKERITVIQSSIHCTTDPKTSTWMGCRTFSPGQKLPTCTTELSVFSCPGSWGYLSFGAQIHTF